MKIENQNPRPVIIAAITASFLMLVLGMGYRVLDSRLSGPGSASPITFAMLERFPMQVGDWTGTEVPLDEAIVRATDTDAHINTHEIMVWNSSCYTSQPASKHVT